MTPAGSWITVIFKIVLSNHVTLRALLTISKSGVFSFMLNFHCFAPDKGFDGLIDCSDDV